MKILKIVLLIILVLAGGFLLLGIIKSDVTYDCEVEVSKSIEESWAVSQDETKLSEWLMGYQKTELVSGTPGTVGAVSNIYFIQDGNEMVIQETIQEIVPNKSMSMVFDSEFMKMDYKMSMEEEDGKTKIKSTTKAVGNGMISKSIMALIGGSIEDQEKTNLTKLKEVIEQNTKDYSDKDLDPEPEVLEDL